MELNVVIKLVLCIVFSLAAGGIGSIFTFKAIPGWYQGLIKPRFTPPNRAFGPVWTALYLLMGISVFLVWQKGFTVNGVGLAFAFFWVQLVFNVLWSVVFFGMKSQSGGVIIIVLLWLLILATLVASFNVSHWAGGLLIPYLMWVSIAAYLNIGIWRLNKSAGGKAAV